MKFLSVLVFSWLLLAAFPQPVYADELIKCRPTSNGNMVCMFRDADGNLYIRTYFVKEP